MASVDKRQRATSDRNATSRFIGLGLRTNKIRHKSSCSKRTHTWWLEALVSI